MPLSPSNGNSSAPQWFKSSHSTDDGPACVEVAAIPGSILIRDSKTPQGPRLTIPSAAWDDFVRFARRQ
ncbi:MULTISPECIES: DUF397 domain-containing protein [Streptomyces]|uniref:DUF397 domain-containing protein n=2 Tax=Streptomyces TaxID=1883 RepID=A0A420V3X1_9ACTN|nr:MULTISPECIES: DUF397 domain-containing protein [Streptomyces]KNE81943.1 hypothetical protein ADZ36_13745 [Streptomyces fradiae]OFA51545.1 DUF397 domain-containing protein [Streptomyces fradiae]PQM20748.1 DUF397 domain-containing protein [Streptomyces xinghaiensis]RKM95933.1 DUF397 domain-containing protein [Streptomyces xinghaiensis]RNC70914.1 DUF397 domain-containing protein [Streptomyces xinghaiensis]